MKNNPLRMALTGLGLMGVLGCAVVLLLLGAFASPATPDTSNTPVTTARPRAATATAAPASGVPNWGHQTKTSGCQASGGRPDPGCTPGDIFPDATADKICVSGYSASVRNVPTSEKNAVYAEYGITHHSTGEYEVDHFVSQELGGSNDISNLFPEAAEPKPGFHEKDRVENYLHDQVCSGNMTLGAAQRAIATNWLAVYDQMPNK